MRKKLLISMGILYMLLMGTLSSQAQSLRTGSGMLVNFSIAEGEGDLEGKRADDSFKPNGDSFATGTTLSTDQNFVVLAKPAPGYQLKAWRANRTQETIDEEVQKMFPLLEMGATQEVRAAHEATAGRQLEQVKLTLFNYPVSAYINREHPIIKGVVYDQYITPSQKGILIFCTEPYDNCPKMREYMKALGFGEGVVKKVGFWMVCEWRYKGIRARLSQCISADGKAFDGAKSFLLVNTMNDFRYTAVDAQEIDIQALFEQIPTAVVNISVDKPELAKVEMYTGEDITTVNNRIESATKVTLGHLVKCVLNPVDTLVRVDSVMINGVKQDLTDDFTATKPYILQISGDIMQENRYNIQICVSRTIPEGMTGIEGEPVVYSQERAIHISTRLYLPYQVVSMMGQTIAQGTAGPSDISIPVPLAGVYIVTVGEQRYKILVE